ncbi:hypothetical protein ALC56_12636 [Trachymyrmex septentrionalis]|uniref:Uncharacterized protein n=1 Tax=Trachymyrmex septentrionalis TaxID=34720 RepID=A0A195EYL8_9HYME|nr:PREDICTED: uncharacterized protein LOC108753882 [Trachymyrmex septentrionalis]KYN33002.1 hypothetical protein ALC56_12636 [Trachymyrmex septentrionalis]
MSSRDEEADMEFLFVKDHSVSQQEKVKAFWKFLDAQNCLQPQIGILEHESPSETEASVSSVEEIMKEKDIWHKGLQVFQQLGLDKTALAADNRCECCIAHKTKFQYDDREDLADTVTQEYEELNADIEAFEQRQKNRDSILTQCEAFCAVHKFTNCHCVKTKK